MIRQLKKITLILDIGVRGKITWRRGISRLWTSNGLKRPPENDENSGSKEMMNRDDNKRTRKYNNNRDYEGIDDTCKEDSCKSMEQCEYRKQKLKTHRKLRIGFVWFGFRAHQLLYFLMPNPFLNMFICLKVLFQIIQFSLSIVFCLYTVTYQNSSISNNSV